MARNSTDPNFFSNSLGMQFRRVEIESETVHDENIRSHKPICAEVNRDFSIGVYLVTQQDYFSVIKHNPSHFQGERVAFENSDRFPVEYVSCEDALQFCRVLGQASEERRANRVYRIPTEAEWELACSVGALANFLIEDYAWIEQNSGGKVHPVGQKKPNSLGLFDMIGNVWEWCVDPSRAAHLWGDGDKWNGGLDFECSFRGGDFDSRNSLSDVMQIHRVSSKYRGNFVGFRLALDCQ